MEQPSSNSKQTKRVFLAGATGYIGRAVVKELLKQNYEVVSFARENASVNQQDNIPETQTQLYGSEVRIGNVCDLESILSNGIRNERFDAVISCIASRTGGIEDSWAVDYAANLNLLEAAKRSGATQFILLSAICVQKPLLTFQHAKLKIEQALMQSGLVYSIVRPTAFFKSLSGQVTRVKQGKSFLVFGNGELTSCKPISESDLARFMVECLEVPDRQNRVLPIGGPGPAITPRQQAEMLFKLCRKKTRIRHIPVQLFNVIIPLLTCLGWLKQSFADKAEYARIGRYYATESMLLFDQNTNTYDASATPEYGNDTLFDFYSRVITEGLEGQELHDHALF